MSEFVSIPVGKGLRATVSRAFAEKKGIEILDVPATDRRGRPLSVSRLDGRKRKPKTTVDQAAIAKAAVQRILAASPAPNNGGVAADPPEEGTA